MLGALLSVLSPILNDVLRRAIPDRSQREKIQAEMTTKLLEQETVILSSMKDVMVADASSSNWLTSAARPMVVYWSLAFVTFITVLGASGYATEALNALDRVPGKLWDLITVGIGAFSITRGLEKSVTAYRKGE